MGVALRRANGAKAQIFFKQVQDFARLHRIDTVSVLACVIAHEIGHLLLPGTPHSPTGLMQARWDRALVHNAATGSLTFTNAEAARMLSAVSSQ
jgi:predicted Zn-dependent protease